MDTRLRWKLKPKVCNPPEKQVTSEVDFSLNVIRVVPVNNSKFIDSQIIRDTKHSKARAAISRTARPWKASLPC